LMLNDVSGQPYVTDDVATVKAEVLRYFTDVWHAPRNCEPLQDHLFWADAYKNRSDYSADVWDGLTMVRRTSENNSAISSAPLRKAPGVSAVAGNLIKQIGSTARSMFCILIQACIAQAKIPLSWTQGLIYCIPNGRVWSGRISETLIHVLNSVMEDAREFN
ncbi:hypothetical protein BGZ74_006201, partial [Mortierella antarctica]